MLRTTNVLVIAIMLGGSVTAVSASDTDTSINDKPLKAYRIHKPTQRRVWLLSQHKAASSKIVSRYTENPILQEKYIKVQVNNDTVYFDPASDFISHGEHRVDANHSIAVAERLFHSLNAKPARIVQNKDAHKLRRRVVMQPTMILLKPTTPKKIENKGLKNKDLKKITIPSVPRPPKDRSRLMVMADN